MERSVQGMIGFLRAKCIEHGTTNGWSLLVKDGAFFGNTKFQRIHGYTPSELIMGFQPKLMHFDLQPDDEIQYSFEDIEPATEYTLHIFAALRDEKKCLASDAVAYQHYQSQKKNTWQQRLPKVGDLVVVRNHSVDS